MTPAFARRCQLFWGKLSIVDKHVRALGQLSKTFVEFGDARLIVSSINDGGGLSFHSKAEAALRVVQPPRRNFGALNIEIVAIADFRKLPGRRHSRQVYWKIGISHLSLETCLRLSRPRNLDRKL